MRGGAPSERERRWLWIVAICTVVALWFGWRVFWFLTDDAFIAFRYVSNSLAGWGYVWNPPPFHPVEGYTSFSWILLLDGIWRGTGLEPPQVANALSLAFGAATVALVAKLFWRMQLPATLQRHRVALLALVLLGTVTNRTTLAWLSSGLETSLFNFALTSWIYVGTAPAPARGRRWMLAYASLAALTALTRPDGLLFFAATAVAISAHLWREASGEPGPDASRPRLDWRALLFAAPLALVPLHLLWRHALYGSWLPNTYYAKHVAIWPESGVRYLACFLLEYAFWIWLWMLVLAMVATLRRRPPDRLAPRLQAALSDPWWITLFAVAAQVAYYTFNIGGDHFEFRVYSYLVPLLLLSTVWLAACWLPRPAAVFAAIGLLVVLSWPIPWVHWWQTKDLATRDETRGMIVPIAHHFPALLRVPVQAWDDLQLWLIYRMVGSRHQEHKVFWQYRSAQLPKRGTTELRWEDRNVIAAGSVGVLGWVLPQVAVIDLFGLNDPVIARSTRPSMKGVRQMAHDRSPPAHYTACYRPNVITRKGRVLRIDRKLTDVEIEACQLIRW